MNTHKHNWKDRSWLAAICIAASLSLVFAHGVIAGSGRPSSQASAVSVGVLGFHDDSGTNAPAELGQKLARQLRQKLNAGYKDLVARALAAGGDSPGVMSVEQLIAAGKQNGVKFVVRGGVLDLSTEAAGEETKISLQLYAEVISVESGSVSTLRVEGAGTQKGGAAGSVRIEAATLSSSEFATSALGLALTNSIEQLVPLVYQSLTGQGSQPTPGADAAPAPANEAEAAVAIEEEELRQLISQAEALLASPGSISPSSIPSLDASVRGLKEALVAKAALLEKGKDTTEADRDVAARKEELQAALSKMTAEAAAVPAGYTPVDTQPSGPKKNLLASIGEYLGETANILQKIQEIRNTFRSVSEDPSQYGALPPPTGEAIQPVAEPVSGVDGVVTESGAPVEGVTVTDTESGASTTTDSAGSYRLDGVLAGKVAKLLFKKNGKQIGSGQVDVPRGRSGVADFDLKPASETGVASAMRVIPSSVLINATKLAAGTKTGKLQGIVEDAQGKPVARALVQLKDMGVARTDSQGRYAFFNVPVGAYRLTVLGSGLNPMADQVQISASGATERRIRLGTATRVAARDSLILRGSGAVLRGVVQDSSGRPVEGAKVTLLQSGQAVSAVTGKQGNFELPDLKPASYRVVVSKVGFEGWSQAIELRAGRTEQSEFRIKRASSFVSTLVEAQRARQGEIKGEVRWSGGEPVAGAMVEIKPMDRAYPVFKTVVTPRGEYALKVPEGRYEVKVRVGAQGMSKVVAVRAGGSSREDFGLRRLSVAGAISPGALRAVTAGRTASTALQAGGISGRVADARRGTPLVGAIVSIEGRTVSRSVRTDQQGGYSFAELPPERYRVTARMSGFSNEVKEVVVRFPAGARQDFALQPETRGDQRTMSPGVLRPQFPAPVEVRRGQIAGRVIDAKSGRPIAGATVAVAGQRPVVTDAQGGFVVVNLMPGDYRVNVMMRGFGNGEGSVTVRSGETAGANFRLVPSPPARLSRP